MRAEDGTRTRDPDLGKVVLYQLSYFRKCLFVSNVTQSYQLYFIPPNILPGKFHRSLFSRASLTTNHYEERCPRRVAEVASSTVTVTKSPIWLSFLSKTMTLFCEVRP